VFVHRALQIQTTDVLSAAVRRRMGHLAKFVRRVLDHRELRYSRDLHTFLCEVRARSSNKT
jgi:hypothetical protein